MLTRFRFGRFEFDAATRELRRDGVLVRLQAQPAQVLACLLERAGQTVSRDDLRQAIWGSETFVDFDRGLNFCISQIRAALKDNSTESVFVRTLPKSGYQFIAPVERIADPAAQITDTANVPSRTKTRNLSLAIGLVALVMVALLAVLWRLRLQHATKIIPAVAVVRFDNETGDPAVTRFSDSLTDNVVEQLTSRGDGHFLVIGNARILRLPRDQRDLNAIGASLKATYVVLGQVQSTNGHIVVLAHLIRLPSQTHIWVARIESTTTDAGSLEGETAQKIGFEFSRRLTADTSKSASLAAAKR